MDAYLHVAPYLFIETNGLSNQDENIYPLSGISNAVTVFCNEASKWSIYESDEHGFNNPQGIHAANKLDIVLIGDSFAQGFCVQPGEDIGSLLRQGGWQILNLGTVSNGPLLELGTLKEYGAPVNPKIVLWVYYEGNDFNDLLREKRSPLLLNYLDDDFSQGLQTQQAEIDQLLAGYVQSEQEKQKAAKRITLADSIDIVKLFNLRTVLSIDKDDDSLEQAASIELFGEILREAQRHVHSWDGKFYFVYLPAWERYGEAIDQDAFYNRAQVLSVVDDLEIPIIDFHDVLAAQTDLTPLFSPLRRHYSAKGYQLLAQQIEEFLESAALTGPLEEQD